MVSTSDQLVISFVNPVSNRSGETESEEEDKKKEGERRGEKKGERRGESGGVSLIIRFQTGVEKQNQTMNHVESERVTGFNGKTRAIVFSLKVI